MLDHTIRVVILELSRRGKSIRRIARELHVSRDAVRDVIAAGTADVPRLERSEKAEDYRDRISELYLCCKGNLVRVHEEILAEGLTISYPALTSFCRRHGLGKKPAPPAGHYHFAPGQEMQHDTSPHTIQVGGRPRKAQVASLVLCYSRLLFFQYYPAFKRFDCKVFLTDALRYVGGSCSSCMIDNTHLVVLKGTGSSMVPVPEMEAFAEHFGFEFHAHEKGDANRSGRVERPFDYIENNFEAGRTGADWQDWNRQASGWCDKVNATRKRHLGASPRELFVAEMPHLRPLPDWIPEVYQLHQRTVSVDGYLKVGGNLYSAPLPPGRQVEVRETKDTVAIYEGPRLIATHPRVVEPSNKRITDPAHRPPRGRNQATSLGLEEQAILRIAPELAEYTAILKQRCRGPAIHALRRLLSMIREYPRPPLVSAIEEATRYGLYDLERLEQMVLKRIRDQFFLLPDDWSLP